MPKNDVYIRSLSGIVFLAAVVVPVVAGVIPFFVLMVIISSFCLFEFLKMQQQNDWVNLTFVLIVNLLLLLQKAEMIIDSHGKDLDFNYYLQFVKFPFIAFLSLIYIILQLRRVGLKLIPSVINTGFSIVYISIPFLLFIQYSVQFFEGYKAIIIDFDWRRPMFVFVLVWSSDTFAYVSGRLFGKHLLFSKLSPKKTIEGLIGGTILAGAAGGILAGLWEIGGVTGGVLMGILVSLFGTAGDLFASAIKRNAGVKDSGNVIPGHGGVLDRFDAFLFASLIVYILKIFVFLWISPLI